MATALQIGSIRRVEDSILVTGVVLGGSIRPGDRIEVSGTLGTASTQKDCTVALIDTSRSAGDDYPGSFFGLVSPGSAPFGTVMAVSLDWASLMDELLPVRSGLAPVTLSTAAESPVTLRFADVAVSGTLQRLPSAAPPGPGETRTVIADRSVAIVPGCGFSMKMKGAFVAMGEVIGVG